MLVVSLNWNNSLGEQVNLEDLYSQASSCINDENKTDEESKYRYINSTDNCVYHVSFSKSLREFIIEKVSYTIYIHIMS